MAWLSRTKKSEGDRTTGEGTSVPPPPPGTGFGAPVPTGAPSPAGAPSEAGRQPSAVGRYGPVVSITSFDQAPIELTWQTPVHGELYRLVPGPDRPDYSIMVLERPVHFYPAERFDLGRVPAERQVADRKGRPMVRVDALVVCSRFVGQQLHPGMRDLPINIAYVIDDRALTDPSLDFATIEYAAIGLLTEGRVGVETAPADGYAAQPEPVPAASDPDVAPFAPPVPAPAPDPASEAAERESESQDRDPLDEVARILREGVEAQRGTRVEHLTATLTLDDAYRVVGLTGAADGTPPVPTHETFERLNVVLSDLRTQPAARPEAVVVTVSGDDARGEARHAS